MTTDKFVFFWGGTFSQWCPSKFTVNGVEYNCCEQYMMAAKAVLFNDTKAHAEIMGTTSPAVQKSIGRKVKGFNTYQWEQICHDVVYEANYAKFTQNTVMLQELINTGTREIVEASPKDKIWGIGMHETHPDILDKSKWQGTNWLGKAIMKVREKILVDFAKSDAEYKEFMTKYRKQHACCPKCGAKEHSKTLVGYIMVSINRDAYKDRNSCVCSNCGDRHIAHDRVPEKIE